MDVATVTQTPTSASKRKRGVTTDPDYDLDQHIDTADPDAHTPKRIRHGERQRGLGEIDGTSPGQRGNGRGKRAFRRLSHLNLRNATQKKGEKSAPTHGSKFQEGSLTDKPSEKPPSVFTRMVRTNSGNLLEVDALMENYYNNGRGAAGDAVEREVVGLPPHLAGADISDSGKKAEGGTFFRFGKQLAQNFHPVALWNKMWNETKEELTQENMEEAQRKARMKSEAEAKYAEMKRTGQFVLQPIENLRSESRASGTGTATPRDSGISMNEDIVMYGDYDDDDDIPSASATSQIIDAYTYSSHELPDTVSKPNKSLKSRLHFKKPSLTNIRHGLKRISSDWNLAATPSHRESSSSLSPVKGNYDSSALRHSQSHYDLKKQQKLTKRVSDLEYKLELARKELDDAIVDASPMPLLTSRTERFTPSDTVKRFRFKPGKLPSLPSERILMAEELGARYMSEQAGDAKPSPLAHLSEVHELPATQDEEDDEADEMTIKAHDNPFRPRLDSLFKPQLTQPTDQLSSPDHLNNDPVKQSPSAPEHSDDMDPNSLSVGTDEGATGIPKQGDYAALDAKLKALEENTKLAKKASKPKKRKSATADDDKPYKPGDEGDDDEDWNTSKKSSKKKRKSTSPKTEKTQAKRGEDTSAQLAKTSDVGAVVAPEMTSSPLSQAQPHMRAVEEPMFAQELVEADPVLGPVEVLQRDSLDSQPLEPLIEEEEETIVVATTKVPVSEAPSKPTAKATPARYRRPFIARSGSPPKRAVSIQPTTPDARTADVLTRSARSSSPPSKQHRRTEDPPRSAVSIMPGRNGVPKLPKGTTVRFEGIPSSDSAEADEPVATPRKKREAFEWPDDVF